MAWEVCSHCNGAKQITYLENGYMKYQTCPTCQGAGGKEGETKTKKAITPKEDITTNDSDSLGVLIGLASIALGFAAAFGLPTQSDEQRLGIGIAATVFSHWILNQKIVREAIRLVLGIAFFYFLYMIISKGN